ncbi:MAG TPA: DUF202 domain-containing protein [Trichocoleus sp.]
MMSRFPHEPSSLEVNELAKERNREAAERTLTAWIQACLVLMGSGIAVDRIVRNLDHFSHPNIKQGLASLTGLSAIALSLLLLVFATLEHAFRLRAIAEGNPLSQPWQRSAALTVGSVLLLGLFVLCLIVLMPE